MTKRRLILAGGTVAFTAIGVVRRYRRPPRVHSATRNARAVVAIPLVGGVMFALPSMPDLPAIFLKFWNLGNVIWDQISNIVLGILSEAWELLEAAVDTAIGAVEWSVEQVRTTVGSVAQEVANIAGAVGSVIVETTNRIDGAFQFIRQQVYDAIQDGWRGITDVVKGIVPDVLEELLGGAWGVLMALVEIGVDGVAFLANLIANPIDFLWDLLRDVVLDAIANAADTLGFAWDAFWGLFWPLLARQLGLPEDPADMIAAAKFLFSIGLLLVKGDVDDALRESVAGAKSYFEERIPAEIHKHADLIVSLVYSAMGIPQPDQKLKEMLQGV